MPARKNRSDKYGVGLLHAKEKEELRRWFGALNNYALYISKSDDTVYGRHGFDSARGAMVRGLITKGYLEPFDSSQLGPHPFPDKQASDGVFVRLTLAGQGVVPDSRQDSTW